VYDLTSPPSCEFIKAVYDDFSDTLGVSPYNFPFLLLANKSDLEQQTVDTYKGEEFPRAHGEMLVFKVSAKDGDVLDAACQAVVKKN
jgi:hypothetical protein